MFRIEVGHEQLHILGIREIFGCLDAADRIEYGRVHLSGQHFVGITAVIGTARHHVGDDEPLEVALVFQGVLHGEDAAPGVAEEEEVGTVEAQCGPNLFNLFHVTGEVPEGSVARVIGMATAELVVVDELDALGGQEALEAFEIFMRGAGASVQEQQLHLGMVAEALGPYAECPFGRFYGNQLNTARQGRTGDRLEVGGKGWLASIATRAAGGHRQDGNQEKSRFWAHTT